MNHTEKTMKNYEIRQKGQNRYDLLRIFIENLNYEFNYVNNEDLKGFRFLSKDLCPLTIENQRN